MSSGFDNTVQNHCDSFAATKSSIRSKMSLSFNLRSDGKRTGKQNFDVFRKEGSCAGKQKVKTNCHFTDDDR